MILSDPGVLSDPLIYHDYVTIAKRVKCTFEILYFDGGVDRPSS